MIDFFIIIIIIIIFYSLSYFIRNEKKKTLMEYKVEYKKWNKGFVSC